MRKAGPDCFCCKGKLDNKVKTGNATFHSCRSALTQERNAS